MCNLQTTVNAYTRAGISALETRIFACRCRF